MKSLILLGLLLFTTGCSSLGTDPLGVKTPYGYKPYDPCTVCGESWRFIPQESFQKRARQQGFEW